MESQFVEANSQYERANKELGDPLATFLQGLLFFDQGQFLHAFEVWNRSSWHVSIAYRLCEFPSSDTTISTIDKKLQAADLGISLAPDSFSVQRRCGRVYEELEQSYKAAEAYRNAAKLIASPIEASKWYIRAGDLLRDMRLWEEALAAYEVASETYSLEPRGLMRMASTFALAGRKSEAIATYQSVIHKFPEHGWAHFNLAEVYEETGNTDKALYWYQSSIGRDPRPGVGALHAGRLLLQQGELEEAIRHFELAIDLEPEDCFYQLWLAKGYRRKNDVTHGLTSYLSATQCYLSDGKLSEDLRNEISAYLQETSDTHQIAPSWQQLSNILSEES